MSLDPNTINAIVLVCAVAYGVFLGYCAGRAKGYSEGADMVKEIYSRK